ncbi:MAG: hypothetical protein KKI08_12255, partial [Armatimonadetes bacterium]|nr:hypothetical protein [Armatimonadota bacterium]
MLAAVWLMAAAPVSADVFGGLNRLFKDWGLFQGLQVSGSNDFTFQQNFVQGSTSAYEGQRWDTEPFIRRSSVSLEGPIWKEFAFKADFSASGYGPAYSRWVAGYLGQDTSLYYGDLNIDLSGNQFASFSKPVQGWQLDQRVGKGLARVFYSTEQAITRYQTIPGNNTTGPYFLTYTPVMEGTEVVKVNEQRMAFGVDYRLDYSTGQLWFEVEGKAPTIIPDTSTISVSYQSSGYESQGSTLYGGRILMPLLKERLQVGVTMIKQDRGAKTSHDTAGYQEDIFNGSGSTGPFDVNFRPILANGTEVVYKGTQQVIEQALVVLVDNIEQAEGVDYDSYRSIGRIIFRRSVPPTSLVAIRYYYDISSSVPITNNMLTGVDLLYHLSPQISLQAEWGRSDGGLDTNSGEALRANLSYTTPRLRFTGEYRDISPTFSFMDSVGFYKQDQGYEVGVDWQPIEHVSLTARHSDLKSSQGYTFGYSGYSGYSGYGIYGAGLNLAQTTDDDTTTLSVGTRRTDLQMRLDFPGWPTLSFQRQDMSNSGSTSDSTYGSTNVNFAWSPKKLPVTLSATLGQTNQGYVPLADTSEATGSSTRQLQWSASYRPSDKLSLSYNQARNSSSSTSSGSSSSSNNDQLSVHWSPGSKLDLNYDFTRTNSLGSVSSGLYNNYTYYSSVSALAAALGVAGIGDGDGIGDDDDDEETTTNRYTDNSHRLALRYSPSQKLNFDFGLMMRKYTSGGSVGYLADSNQTTGSVNASYMLSNALSLNLAYTNDRMQFLDEDRGTVLNNTISMGANYRPSSSRWGFGLTYNMLTGSSPTYTGYGSSQKMRIVDNNMSDLQARISYSLGQDSELSILGQLSDYAGGYANFNRQQVEIGYRRRLSNSADLNFGYRFSRNVTNGETDPRYGNTSLVPQGQNYIANTFLLTLSTQFTTGVGGRASGSGGFGGASGMSGFTGYRSGVNMGMYGTGSQYGTGYGTGFGSTGVYGTSPLGSGYSNPFGSGGLGGSTGSLGSFGNTGTYGSYGNQPQGYDTFGSGFGGQGGFSQGLGDISGRPQ